MFLLIALSACGTPCNLEDQAWALVPDDATDCGEDLVCFNEAVADGEPAVAMGSSQGIDSILNTAHVWTGDHLWWLSQEDDFRGGSREIDARECVDPEVVDGAVVCGQVGPQGNHYAVCGNQRGGSPEPLPFEP